MKSVKLTFSGDIMLDNEIIDTYKIENNNYNFDSIFEDVKQFLSESDFVIGNLETPITRNYEEIKHIKYRFTSPVDFAKAVKNAGFDFVSTANNHCLDNGINGAKETIKSLNEIGLQHTGISYGEDKISIIDINNIKIAILSYTYGTNAFSNNVYLNKQNDNIKINLLQNQELKNPFTRKLYQSKNLIIRVIRKIFCMLKMFQLHKPIYERKEKSFLQKKEIINRIAKSKELGADYIIMCMHSGGQYNLKPLKTTIKNAEFMQKNGVDLIVGNHEHIVQNVEIKNNKLITYCLGNFLSVIGILEGPFDKMAEYSILLNTYLIKNDNDVQVEKNTFTILKTVLDKNKLIKIRLLYDLINECDNEEEKYKLMLDNKKIVSIVTKQDINVDDVKKEYVIN